MIQQVEITLSPKSRGFHLVTSEVMRQLPKLPKTGSHGDMVVMGTAPGASDVRPRQLARVTGTNYETIRNIAQKMT